MQEMKKHLLLLGFLIAVLLVFAGCSQQAQPTAQKAAEEEKQVVAEAAAPEEATAEEATAAAPAEQPAKTLFQLVQEEPNTNGCVNCHVTPGDNQLANKVKKVSDKHPTLDEKTNSVDTCFGCHNDNNPEIYQRFKNRLHKAHSQSQYFTPKYNGTCYTCHTLNENGELSIKRPQQQ